MKMHMPRAVRKQAQAGFTLIELIVVIVILGILAATALPKFADLGGDARVASLKAVRGSLESVSAMVHGHFLISPEPTVTMEGVVIGVTHGYPTGDAQLGEAAGLKADDFLVATAADGANTPAITAGQIAVIPESVAGTTAGATCYVLYSPATSAGTPAVITPPSMSMDVTGC